MRLDTVHHIAIITKDYDQTIDFFEYPLSTGNCQNKK